MSRELGNLAERLADTRTDGANDGDHGIHRVRLVLSRTGEVRVESWPLEDEKRTWSIQLAAKPIDPQDRLYFHKTTARSTYEAFRSEAPDADDVLLWNPTGGLTETLSPTSPFSWMEAGTRHRLPVACSPEPSEPNDLPAADSLRECSRCHLR